jgi:hypothetical protein
MSDDRHLETLAQLAHSDHATPTGPVAWDRCDQPLCRTSQAVLADERRHPMPDVRFGPSPNVGEPVAAENIVVGEDVVARLVTELSEARAALAHAEARTAALVEACLIREHFPKAHPTQRDFVTCRLCDAVGDQDNPLDHVESCLLAGSDGQRAGGEEGG